MVSLKIKNDKSKTIKINSNDVKSILTLREDLEHVEDISDSINQNNIMAFDCKLSPFVLSREELESILEEMEEEIIEDDYFDIHFEDVRAYIKDTLDEIESEIQEKYSYDNIKCYFKVYNIDDLFKDFKFVLVISFSDIKLSSLSNLTSLISDRQLKGASKFYN